jgi:hypothetical protein
MQRFTRKFLRTSGTPCLHRSHTTGFARKIRSTRQDHVHQATPGKRFSKKRFDEVFVRTGFASSSLVFVGDRMVGL